MKLSQIAAASDSKLIGDGDVEVSSLSCDSRTVVPGALFAALPGVKSNGLEYVDQALRLGAVAVLAEKEIDGLQIPCLVSDNPRKALAYVAAEFYGRPSEKLRLIGITGTNGKTTVAYGIRHVLSSCGEKVGMLGTIQYDNGDVVVEAPLTTPESVDFSRYLAEMVANGVGYAVVEASSHALAQERIAGHHLACAVFTNLTRDHLDYHADMDDYCQAKQRLFEYVANDDVAILNHENGYSAKIAEGFCGRTLWYGFEDRVDVRAVIIESGLDGTRMRLEYGGDSAEFKFPLIGSYNVENCLAIASAAFAMGKGFDEVVRALSIFTGAPGRLERFEKNGITVFVDYAHTDDALRSVLRVLRPLSEGKLVTVFGCGGNRDKGKRPLMAEAAEEFSNVVYVTNDNPRDEDPEDIIRDICAGFEETEKAAVVPDRAEAIAMAIADSAPGDTVLVAGKGHENYQIAKGRKLHFDDREIVRSALGIGKNE